MAVTLAAAALLAVSGCTATHTSSSSSGTAAASVVTHPSGTGCRDELIRAARSTLSAPSFTVDQSPWREHLDGPTVAGGGAATISFQAPDRERVVPSAVSGRTPPEVIVIGRRWWQGSTSLGWAAFTTRTPSDPLAWLRPPLRATAATWDATACHFTARVAQGQVSGEATLSAGRMTALSMRLRDGGTTIDMAYRITRIGSSPPVTAPR
jgi:hypothetical protein